MDCYRWLLIVVVIIALVGLAVSWPDVMRYLRIRRM
jgi:DNA-binding transcriptional regulator of glucitol operon